MHKRIPSMAVILCALGAFWVGRLSLAVPAADGQEGRPAHAGASRQDVEGVVHETETQLREQLNQYEERLRKIEFSNLKPGRAYPGVHDSIQNGYNGSYKAMYRIRGEGDAKISRMRPPVDVKRNALQTLQRSLDSNLHTLRMRYDDAMRKLRQAEGQHGRK